MKISLIFFQGGREGGREGGRREGGNIDCSMVHHVTMTYDLANTQYMLIIYCNFPITLIRLATKQSKVFKNGHYNQSTMSKIQTINIKFTFVMIILPVMTIRRLK